MARPWSMCSPPIHQCWVIKRKTTGTVYTINGEAEGRRCLMTFRVKGNANQFKRFVQDTEGGTKNKQKLVLEQVHRSSLIQRCALASLDLFIYEESRTYTALDEPTEEVRIFFENSYCGVAPPHVADSQ